jgi:hypothetical protein
VTWEGVPWAVANTALHSEQVLRLLAYYATQANEGVLSPGDLKVTQQTVATSSVQVAPGACAILVKNASLPYQTYIGRNPSIDTPIAIAATGGAVRSDMVIVQVEDPNNPGEGWSAPGNLQTGPYIFTRVLSGVPSTARTLADAGFSTRNAIPLARIDIPVSTSAITNAMITDLRVTGNPRSQRKVYTIQTGAGPFNLTANPYADWFGAWNVDIPTWATQAVILAMWGGIRLDRFDSSTIGSATGNLRVRIGGTSAAPTLVTQNVGYNYDTVPQANVERKVMNLGDTISITSGVRGTTQVVALQGQKTGGNKNLFADQYSFASVDIEFIEAAV